MPYKSGQVKSFPETPRTGTQGDERPSHIKSSQRVGDGHEASDNRMPHPFGQDCPTSGSGEGQNK